MWEADQVRPPSLVTKAPLRLSWPELDATTVQVEALAARQVDLAYVALGTRGGLRQTVGMGQLGRRGVRCPGPAAVGGLKEHGLAGGAHLDEGALGDARASHVADRRPALGWGEVPGLAPVPGELDRSSNRTRAFGVASGGVRAGQREAGQ